ncbi:UDP-N-acetylmuramoyl-L-alanyl-D-glutamate--2,6-diaminopimelate ligase [Candidatus Shapirobacteria bacterium]|nr:UDP-N-acetylmuramoyl-L-alanyl-D-glutamate--2,6-diaminopimelate ligase [Candidatus Shapirobacteria bacterium]
MTPQTVKIYIQKLKNIFWHLPKSIFFNFYYGFPSRKLTLVAVTGTDGKTTTVNLLHELLLQSGVKVGSISTLGAKIGEKNTSVGLHTTSPDSKVVQEMFKKMVEQGITHAVIEVTAHAIDQYRFWGCHFEVALITNTSHEHLDDFFDMAHYISTKAKLFTQATHNILNKDDPSYKVVTDLNPKNLTTYSTKEKADYRAAEIKLTPTKLSFYINKTLINTDSNYLYQVSNILAAFAAANILNISVEIFKKVVRQFPSMQGRREEVKNDLGIRCIVDFAHTPAAISSTLETIRATSKGKNIIIFGATGGRDQSKRPIMGKIVSELADIAIITADDTRHEKIEVINKQIISGIDQSRVKSKKFSYHNIPGRQDAFNYALKIAQPGDTVIACGKGHENTILHGNTEYPWSESEAFRTALRHRNQNNGNI